MTLIFSSAESARIRDSIAIYNHINPDSGYQLIPFPKLKW